MRVGWHQLRPLLRALGAEPGLAGPRAARPYKAEECAGWGGGGAEAASPALLGLCSQAGWLGDPRNSPPRGSPSLGRPRLGYRSRPRTPDWQEGRSLHVSQLSDPVSSLRPLLCLVEGRLGFTGPSMVFFSVRLGPHNSGHHSLPRELQLLCK